MFGHSWVLVVRVNIRDYRAIITKIIKFISTLYLYKELGIRGRCYYWYYYYNIIVAAVMLDRFSRPAHTCATNARAS